MNGIERTIYEIKKQFDLRKATGNLGPVIEENGNLTCYVNNIMKQKDYYGYLIKCEGLSEKDNSIINKYNLNRQVRYIIEEKSFGKEHLTIYGNIPCEVEVRNCTINSLTINISGKCKLETLNLLKSLGNLIISADNIELNSVRIRNLFYQKEMELDILFKARKSLGIKQSYIGRENEMTNITIISPNQIVLNNSIVSANEIKTLVPSIKLEGHSEINAEKLNTHKNDEVVIKTLKK